MPKITEEVAEKLLEDFEKARMGLQQIEEEASQKLSETLKNPFGIFSTPEKLIVEVPKIMAEKDNKTRTFIGKEEFGMPSEKDFSGNQSSPHRIYRDRKNTKE